MLGVGEEEVLLVPIAEPREPGRDPITTCSTPPNRPLPMRASMQTRSALIPRHAIHADDMAAPEPKVSIVIPNRDGATLRDGLTFLDMVRDTLAGQSFRDFEVVVVDNGSSDDSVAHLREHWPESRVIELGENRGFSGAVNPGIAAAGSPYVALLNTDIELSPDWLELLVGELERDPRLGFVTGKIMRFDDRDVIEQVGHDFYTCGRFEPRGAGRAR